MKTNRRRAQSRRAFTLIELLVVIGIMAVVSAIIGVGLSRGGDATTLAAAESLMVSQINAARAQAALSAGQTALVVAADADDPERERRFVAVAVDDAGTWRVLNDGTRLPGNAVVRTPAEGSTLFDPGLEGVALDPGNETTLCYLAIFEATGRVAQIGSKEVWLSIGERTSTGWTYATEAPARGIALSRYGAISSLEVVLSP